MSDMKNSARLTPAGEHGLLKYELTSISHLKPAARNAREHGKAQLAALEKSIAAFGTISPVIIDGNNRIVAGHGRVEAAKRAGLLQISGQDAGAFQELGYIRLQ